MIYSKDDAKRILKEVYDHFVSRLSDGEDDFYAEMLKKIITRVEKKL